MSQITRYSRSLLEWIVTIDKHGNIRRMTFRNKKECIYIWYSLWDPRKRHRRIVSVNFGVIYHPRKNEQQHDTVEGEAERFSGCRQQIPRSSWRNPHPEKLWQPSLTRATTYGSLSRPFHRHFSMLSFSSILRRITLSSRFSSASQFFFFFLQRI